LDMTLVLADENMKDRKKTEECTRGFRKESWSISI
jgi:hypothetical protein